MSEPFKTPLQDGVEYKAEVISRIVSSQRVVELLLDKPGVDLESVETFTALDNTIFDFDYIDRTVERSDAFIMVDADMVSPASASFNTWELYVQIVCHKGYVRMDPKKFKGTKGNRRDVLVNEIDKLLNGTDMFGVGDLELLTCVTSVVPDSFTSKMLTYRIKEPRRERFGGKF